MAPSDGPGAPGPVPVSSCRSCMSCKYCFPEDQLPPGYRSDSDLHLCDQPVRRYILCHELKLLLVPRVEVEDLSPVPRAARAASYMSAMGLWHPQTGPGAPGPVPVSSCSSCMSCKYCFPEDQLPPG